MAIGVYILLERNLITRPKEGIKENGPNQVFLFSASACFIGIE